MLQQPQYEGQSLEAFDRQLDAEADTLNSNNVIKDVAIVVTAPVNILPDGTRDLTKDHWVYGGTSYLVTTTNEAYRFTVQVVNDEWYCADWGLHHKSLNTLILLCIEEEQALKAYYDNQ